MFQNLRDLCPRVFLLRQLCVAEVLSSWRSPTQTNYRVCLCQARKEDSCSCHRNASLHFLFPDVALRKVSDYSNVSWQSPTPFSSTTPLVSLVLLPHRNSGPFRNPTHPSITTICRRQN